MFDTVMSFTNTEEIETVLQFINMLNLFLFSIWLFYGVAVFFYVYVFRCFI